MHESLSSIQTFSIKKDGNSNSRLLGVPEVVGSSPTTRSYMRV